MSGVKPPLLHIPPYREQEKFYFMVDTSMPSITQDYMPTAYGGKVISNYVEVWCAPSAADGPCINLSQNKVLDIECWLLFENYV